MNYTLYFAILAILWLAIWACAVWYFETRRTRGPLLRRLSGKRRALLIAGLVLIPCLYLLSYAPYKRFEATVPVMRPTIAALDDLYVPVQWVFDHTALQAPMIRWAQIWGVPSNRLIGESESRMKSFWGTTPPWLYATGWVLIGIAWCLLPPYLFYRFWFWCRTKWHGGLRDAHPAT